MTFEECSKEELIHYIKSECLHSARDLEFCVLMYRCEKAIKQEELASKKASEALRQYVNTLKPYEGKLISEVPDGVLRTAAGYEKIYNIERANATRYGKEWTKLNKRIDANLEKR